MTIDERQEMAHHEAGHAISYLADGLRVARVEIGNSSDFAAYTLVEPHDLGSLAGLTGLLAGLAAARYWLERRGLLDAGAEEFLADGARTDLANAHRVAGEDLLVEARARADRLVRDRWAEIEMLAADLAGGGLVEWPTLRAEPAHA